MPVSRLRQRHAAWAWMRLWNITGSQKHRKRGSYLVCVPNFLSQLILLEMEICSGDDLLVYFTLPFSLDYNGLSAAHSQLHVLDHLLLLFQQLPVLDLGTQDGGAGQGSA